MWPIIVVILIIFLISFFTVQTVAAAHESLFNRRLRVLSPAVRTNDRRSPRRRSKKLRLPFASEHESRLLKKSADWRR
jgi:hypothetical protein